MTYRTAFETTILDEPPSSIDVDRAIAGARRRQRGRRLAGAGATVVAVAAGVGWAFVSLPGFGAGPVQPAASATKPSITSDPPRCSALTGAEPTEPEGAAIARLTSVAPSVVLDAAPNAVFGGDFAFQHSLYAPGAQGNACWSGENVYWTVPGVLVTVGDRSGEIILFVERGFIEPNGDTWPICPGSSPIAPTSQPGPAGGDIVSCDEDTGPDGERVVTMTFRQGSVSVHVARADGSLVSASAQPAASGELADLPLGAPQLTQIALDPRLTIYP
jgi:hypothetical protein